MIFPIQYCAILTWILFILLSPITCICPLTGLEPEQPSHALKFCELYPVKSCCKPSHDSEMLSIYLDLVPSDNPCLQEHKHLIQSIRHVFCLGCDPDSDKYVNMQDKTFRICNSLAAKLDTSDIDDCGLVLPRRRGDSCSGSQTIYTNDRYDASTPLGRAELFLNDSVGGKPPYFEDFSVQVIDCTGSDCNCLGYSGSSKISIYFSILFAIFIIILN